MTSSENSPVLVPKSGLTLERQTHLVAGLLVASGLSLHLVANPWWLVIAALPAFGLLLHASTGVCPMTLLLNRMPWNWAQ